MAKRKQVKTYKPNTQKRKMLQALHDHFGIISTACEQAGIGRTTHYDWLKADPDYAAKVDAINERTGDFVESRLLKNIKDGREISTIFYCKTKLKKRGYIEKQEIEHSGQINTVVVDSEDSGL